MYYSFAQEFVKGILQVKGHLRKKCYMLAQWIFSVSVKLFVFQTGNAFLCGMILSDI